MTEEELQRIEERLRHLNSDRWVGTQDQFGNIFIEGIRQEDGSRRIVTQARSKTIHASADFDFLVASREDVPALCAAVREQQTTIDALCVALDDMTGSRPASLLLPGFEFATQRAMVLLAQVRGEEYEPAPLKPDGSFDEEAYAARQA